MGELMSKLQDLEASDPDKAKQVLAKIAGDLLSQAEQTGDDRMKALAGKFDEASKTGDLSVLEPRHHGGGHHHRPPGDAASANPATDAGKLASYVSAQHDRMADIESIISSALEA